MNVRRLRCCTPALILATAALCLAEERFEPTWESLSQNDIPEWLQDAKFGVYTHWGVYSVPAHGGPDYVSNLYNPGEDRKGVQAYHKGKYGSREDFGYTDFIPMFKAEKFNADEWVGLMHEAGAKFGGICLVHHDGFLLWDSKVSRWNSMNMGPKRDIYGEIAKAVRGFDDMHLLATFHHGRTYQYAFNQRRYAQHMTEEVKAWEVFDPELADFYWGVTSNETFTVERFADEWRAKIKEVIDNYQPDAIWFDGLRTSMKNDHPPESYVLEVFAHYFNQAAREGREVTICNKHAGDFNFPAAFGLRCFENGRDMPYDVGPWFLIDRAIGYPWSYVNNKTYRDGSDYHVRSLVDLVSRGGVFLLSLTPKGDGSVPEEEQEIMRGIGRWLAVNGDAIYATRPWKVFAEGPATLVVDSKDGKGRPRKSWDYRQSFTSRDIRFTQSKDGKILYVSVLRAPEDGSILVTSLREDSEHYPGDITSVRMLGTDEEIAWRRTPGGLRIEFPEKLPCEHAFSFAVE